MADNDDSQIHERKGEEKKLSEEVSKLTLVREPSLQPTDLATTTPQEGYPNPGRAESSFEKLSSSMTAVERRRYAGLMPWERLDAESPEMDIHNINDPEERVKAFLRAIPVNYKVIRTLGSGHNGIVFAAKEVLLIDEEEDEEDEGILVEGDGQGGLERQVAIKVLSSQRPGHLSRKLREMTALTFLPPHPNIVKLLSRPVSSQGYEYFIMELCDRSLEDWIEEQAKDREDMTSDMTEKYRPTLGPEAVIQTLFELCDAIVLLRKFGVTHRDIKPANILLSPRPRSYLGSPEEGSFTVKLADFGVADLMVGGTPTRYENFIGAIPEAAVHSKVYTSEDDFRAAIASVFFAWIGEAHWEEKRRELYTDSGFTNAATRLRLNTIEWQILGFFERALPTNQKDQDGEMLTLDGAVQELKELGRVLGMKLELVADGIGIDAELLKYSGNLSDMKLNSYCSNALDYASGRRRAKDFQTAQEYLDYVEDLFDMFEGEVPPARRAGLNFQKALILLHTLQLAVREYTTLHRDQKLKGGNHQDNKALRFLGKKVERSLRDIRSSFKEGIVHVPHLRTDEWDGPGKSQFVNLEILTHLEETKYFIGRMALTEAARSVDTGLRKVEASLDSFLESPGGERLIDSRFEYVVFAHRRNKYLLQHEMMKIDHMKGNAITPRLVDEAIEGCRQGVGNIYRMEDPKVDDILEMRRCYAESLCIGDHYEEARAQCQQLYEDFGNIPTTRVGIARVLALWITTLRRMNKVEYLSELGFVYGVFVNMHVLSAKAMCRNAYFGHNARAFLSPEKHVALAFGADPLLPVPLIPADNVFIRRQADKALEAVETAIAESKQG